MSRVENAAVPVRCILLGASNVTLAFPLIAAALTESLPAGSEIFAAHGHGRSYLRWSSVFHRSLPGITGSRLWDDLAERPPAEKTLALITDVGNDLIYGEPHDVLADGVSWCLARLQERNAEIVCVRPPLDRLRRLSPFAYHAFKRLFFPGPTRPWEEMKALAIQLDASLQSLACKSSARLITPDESWYGADPIHIRRSRRREAWQRILSEWPWDHDFRVSPVSATATYRWWTLRPAERRAFRRTQTEVQPVLSDPQGVSVWLY